MSAGRGVWYEWFPPHGGTPVVFGAGLQMRIVKMTGLSQSRASVATARAPGQYGETMTDVTIAGRVIGFTAVVECRGLAAALVVRDTLVRAFSVIPRGPVAPQAEGTLRVHREDYGLPTLDIVGIPRDSPQIEQEGPNYLSVDVDIECPYPYFMATSDTELTLESAGGFVFPIEFPFDIPTYNITQEIVNPGNVPAPVVMRLYGAATNPRLKNVTTGETMQVNGDIPAGQYVEIDTRFGRKDAALVNSLGVRQPAIAMLSLPNLDFWWLRPGVNVITFEADSNTSGRATLAYRARYSGL
jgi:hypothetical protein